MMEIHNASGFVGHQNRILDILVLHDGTLLTCSLDNTIQRWMLVLTDKGGRQFRHVQTFHQNASGVQKLVQWDEEHFVNSSRGGKLVMRKIESGEIMHTVSTYPQSIHCLRRLKSRNMLATTNGTKDIKLWSVSEKYEISLSGTLFGNSFTFTLCELESGLLASGSAYQVDIWDLDTKESIRRVSRLPQIAAGLTEVEGGVVFLQSDSMWFWKIDVRSINNNNREDSAKSIHYCRSYSFINLSRNRNILCFRLTSSSLAEKQVQFVDVTTGTALATYEMAFDVRSIAELTSSKRHIVVGGDNGELGVIPVPNM